LRGVGSGFSRKDVAAGQSAQISDHPTHPSG
jgi:hypothetical protein